MLLAEYGEHDASKRAAVLDGAPSTKIRTRVEARIRYRDPVTGDYHFSTYGYDPKNGDLGRFFLNRGDKGRYACRLFRLFALEWGEAHVGGADPATAGCPFLPLPPVLAGQGPVPLLEFSAADEAEGASPQVLPT